METEITFTIAQLFNYLLAGICVLGSIFWALWAINPYATGTEGTPGPGKLLNRIAYILSSLFVFQTAMTQLGFFHMGWV